MLLSYHQCLTRCGAWADLLHSYTYSASRLTATGLTANLRLAGRMANNPKRYCTLTEVDREACELLLGEVRKVVGRVMWREVKVALWGRGRKDTRARDAHPD